MSAIREYFDLIIIVPLEEELHAFTECFPEIEERSTALQYRAIVDCGNASVKVLVGLQEDMGKGSASQSCSSLLRDYDAGLIVCMGIAGGLSKDMRLGDVCYSGEVLDVYDNSKVSDDDGVTETKWSPSYHKTPRNITQALSFSRLAPAFKATYRAWQAERQAAATKLMPEAHQGRDGRAEVFELPTTKPGAIACAAVTDSPTYNARLLKMNRRLLAVETESGGVFEQAEVHGRPVLVLRGISDYADPKKGELEQKSKGEIRKIAALNCAGFLRLQFSNPRFLQVLDGLRSKADGSVDLFSDDGSDDPVGTALGAMGEEVDSKLRELSPEFRLQPKGYKLPIPRIRLLEVESQGRVARATNEPSVDIRAALKERKNILLQVARTYPDRSLSWVIADDLLTAELDEKPVLPIVIDGGAVRPPRSGLERLSPIGLEALKSLSDVQVVFVIDGLPLDSKTGLRFMLEEADRWPDARFLYVHRGDINLVLEAEFVANANVNTFTICDVSFYEISMFIQKNFEMTGPEAGVIALRLRETFNKFKLAAHPTYFAGIPKGTLSALLQANRRAELIQLAVDGFLTFLVAGDPADIALSRTTRSRFLQKLAFEIKSQLRSFDQQELIAFTAGFSEENDFEIESIQFIQAFIDRGILHFEAGKVQITLPFIESYLLALALRDDDEAAKRYFDVYSPTFDMLTFDIYAELGASPAIVEKVLSAITESTEGLPLHGNAEHVLLSGEINPEFLRRQERITKLQDRVARAIDAVRSDAVDLTEKQRLLDVAEKVEQTVAARSKEAADTDGITKDEAFERAVRSWAVGAALLGAGAEHLNAPTKRDLAAKLVSLANLIIDRWTRIILSIDFDALKKDLKQKELVDELVRSRGDTADRKEIERTIDLMIDILEFNALSEPFRRMLNHLCEEARHKVLGMSVANATVAGELEDVLRGCWLMEIDSKKGVQPLRTAFQNLQKVAFLRVNIANHFLNRSFWSQSEKVDRLSMLDAALDSLKSIGLSIETKNLRTLIEKKGSSDEVDDD